LRYPSAKNPTPAVITNLNLAPRDSIGTNQMILVLGYLYFEDGKVSTVDSDIMKGGLSLGMVIGQLLFGESLTKSNRQVEISIREESNARSDHKPQFGS
jgi:hypothetical protein